VPVLQRGSDAQFAAGDVAIFPRGDAELLIIEGKAEEVEPIFVRRLRHYEYTLRELSQRLVRLNADIARVQRDTEAMTQSNRRAEEQIQFRGQERTNLGSDLAKFQYELQEITTYVRTLQQTWDARREDLSRVYTENHRLTEELAELEREVTRQIDARSAGVQAQ
jgi:chromosome segregation ATPase